MANEEIEQADFQIFVIEETIVRTVVEVDLAIVVVHEEVLIRLCKKSHQVTG